MGFKNIEQFFKKINALNSPQRAKITENRDFFNENGLLLLNLFYNQLIACTVIYYRQYLLKLRRVVYNIILKEDCSKWKV